MCSQYIISCGFYSRQTVREQQSTGCLLQRNLHCHLPWRLSPEEAALRQLFHALRRILEKYSHETKGKRAVASFSTAGTRLSGNLQSPTLPKILIPCKRSYRATSCYGSHHGYRIQCGFRSNHETDLASEDLRIQCVAKSTAGRNCC